MTSRRVVAAVALIAVFGVAFAIGRGGGASPAPREAASRPQVLARDAPAPEIAALEPVDAPFPPLKVPRRTPTPTPTPTATAVVSATATAVVTATVTVVPPHNGDELGDKQF